MSIHGQKVPIPEPTVPVHKDSRLRILRIAPGLLLPIDAATKRLAFLGTTGSGKTYAAMKVAEQMFLAGVQIVAVDVVGVWWGLRLHPDGKHPGFPIPIFGGLHGDVAIGPEDGGLIADLIVDRGISAVIDISQMDSDTEARKFATGFGKRLFDRRKAKPAATAVFLEESQELIPENPMGNHEKLCLHAWTRVSKMGRNFGLGINLISQRPQEISKKCLNLTECMFAFQMNGPHERNTIRDWVKREGGTESVIDILPRLEIGHPYVYSPRWLKVSEVYAIGKRDSFDASSTPEVGEARETEVNPLTARDLAILKERLAATIEKRKADDPIALHAEISELKKELTRACRVGEHPADIEKHQATLSKLRIENERAQALIQELRIDIREMKSAVSKQARELRLIAGDPITIRETRDLTADIHPPGFIIRTGAESARSEQIDKAARIIRESRPLDNDALSKMDRAMLIILAQGNAELSRTQILARARYVRNGHTSKTMGRLVAMGWVTEGKEGLAITRAGLDTLGPFEALPVGRALFDNYVTGSQLSTMEKNMLKAVDEGRGSWGREEVLKCAGYVRNGHTSSSIAALINRGLVIENGRALALAGDLMGEM